MTFIDALSKNPARHRPFRARISEYFSNTFSRIAGPRGMRQSVALIILIPLSFGSIVNDPQRPLSKPVEWTGAVLQAGFIAWLSFTVLGFVLRWVLKKHTILRGVVFMLAYGFVEALRATLVAFHAQALSLGTVINWPYRLVAGSLTGVVMFTLVAVVIEDRRRYIETAGELLRSQDTLRRNLEITERDVAMRREELLSSVREVVETALRAVAAEVSASPEVLRRTVSELVRVSDSVVRPLSHELYELPESFLAVGKDKLRVPIRRAIQSATVTAPFQPESVTLILLFMLAGGALLLNDKPGSGFFNLVLGLAITYSVLWLLRRFIAPVLPRLSIAVRLLLIGVGFSIWPLLVWSSYSTFAVAPESPWVYLYVVILGLLLQGMIGFVPGLNAARDEALSGLTNVNKRLRWLNARLGARLWADRKAVARSLHRDVQGVLLAAAFRLQSALAKEDDVEDAVSEVRELVELAASFVVQTTSSPQVAVVLEQLAEQWRDVIEISTVIPQSVIAVLDEDNLARQSFADVVAEFVTNSVKHGHATQVSIVGSCREDNEIVSLECTNDGEPRRENLDRVGLGQRMLETVSVSNEFDNVPGGVRLRVQLPVEA